MCNKAYLSDTIVYEVPNLKIVPKAAVTHKISLFFHFFFTRK